MFPCAAFLSCVVGECLSKCPDSKKTLPSQKNIDFAPDALFYWMLSRKTV